MRKLLKNLKGKYILHRASKDARENGRDLDGDFFIIGNKQYWVDILHKKYAEQLPRVECIMRDNKDGKKKRFK